MFLLLISNVNITSKLMRVIFSVEITYFHWTQCKNFLLMEFSLNNREKNCFHTGSFGSKHGFDKCFPKCHQDRSLQLLWKFQNSPKNPKCCCVFFFKSLNHIFKLGFLLLLTLEYDN